MKHCHPSLKGGALVAAAACFLTTLTTPSSTQGAGLLDTARTNAFSLNDLIREIPIISHGHKERIVELAAVQELVLIHEQKMRGEGFPSELQLAFADSYNSIIDAMVNDRINHDCGRELLAEHRCLLAKAYDTATAPLGAAANAATEGEMIAELGVLNARLAGEALPFALVPDEIRTPMLNGHQVWVEEMLFWGCHCRQLSRGELGHLKILLHRIEKFEGYYKRDGILTRHEREELHERLLELNNDLLDALSD